MKINVLVLVFLFCSQLVLAQLQIRSLEGAQLDYCGDPVEIGPLVFIAGEDIPGLKISISNYESGEDRLSFAETEKIKAAWNANLGTLLLTGDATAEEYRAAVEQVEYTNLAASPTNGIRSIAVTLQDVDYLPETGHFYENIRQVGISWTDAKVAAEARAYYGLQGYLATIKSQVENDFIWSKVQGFGWIGASDEAVEGDWRWVTGPVAEQTLFWRGTYNGGQRVNNEFSFWSSGEPNNAGPEHYAHINQNPDKAPKSWNDLQNEGDGPTSTYYNPQGYIVEYGGMPGDSVISLSASFDIHIRKIQFAAALDTAICQNEEVRLNHDFEGSYEWFPKAGLDDPERSNPIASPSETAVYKVVSTNGTCVDSAFFRVQVNRLPVVDFGDDRNICIGDSTELDAGVHTSYDWSTGYNQQKFYTSEADTYGVLVKNEFGCETPAEVNVTVHAYPVIDLTATDTLFCDSKTGQIAVEVDKGQLTWEPATSGMSFSADSNPSEATATDWGTYKTYLTATDAYGCATTDSLNLSFYKTPESTFSIDSAACYGYNLDILYTGDGTLEAEYNWFFFDSVYASGTGLTEVNVALGFDSRDNRTLGLMVNEGGCLSDTAVEYIKVIPNLEISVVDEEGCEPFLVDFSANTTEPVTDFTWSFGDGGSSAEQNPAYTYKDDGVYDVGLRIVSEEGCENYGLMESMIRVNPVPTVETSLDPDSCFDHQFAVHYTGSANPQDIYHWDLSALDAEEVISDPGSSQGPFEVGLINKPQATIGLQITTEHGCESEPEDFPFKRKPWVQLNADLLEGCSPLEVNFQALPVDPVDELSYSWAFGGAAYEDESDAPFRRFDTPDQELVVSAIATSSLTGCADTSWLEQSVRVFPKPSAAFNPNPAEVNILEPEIQFENESGGADYYYWNFGDSIGFSEEEAPNYSYNKMGWFEVELIAENEFFCVDTTTQKVFVIPDRIFPPNAFNPNSSNPENRVFIVRHDGVLEEGYHLQIFNRWGERVYEAKDEFRGWDGKMKNGQNAPTGVYTWVLGYHDFLGKKQSQSGTVTLVY
jgi:gliding motility-associated-like protein